MIKTAVFLKFLFIPISLTFNFYFPVLKLNFRRMRLKINLTGIEFSLRLIPEFYKNNHFNIYVFLTVFSWKYTPYAFLVFYSRASKFNILVKPSISVSGCGNLKMEKTALF